MAENFNDTIDPNREDFHKLEFRVAQLERISSEQTMFIHDLVRLLKNLSVGADDAW